MYVESNTRSLLKTVTWRVVATAITILIVYSITGGIKIAFMAGGIEVVLKMLFFYLHERVWNKFSVGRFEKADGEVGYQPFVLWFTGLPSSGKTTLARKVAAELSQRGIPVEQLDGDAVRAVLPGTGFSQEERNRHIKQMGFVASKLEDSGVCVVASFVSPYRESREFSRSICKNFIEVYVSTPLEECERRDVKGLYAKARAGDISSFTGVSDVYEAPTEAELSFDTTNLEIDDCAQQIVKYLKERECVMSMECVSVGSGGGAGTGEKASLGSRYLH